MMKTVITENVKEVKENIKAFRLEWYMWLFPFVAFCISAYLFKIHYYDHGPVIKISFDDASVIQKEKTKLKFRGVDIGIVKQTYLTADHKDVIVDVQLVKGADRFAVEGSKFWIVTPKVSLQGLSGLDTLFSGPYIEVLPGPDSADMQTQFKGRQDIQTSDTSENTSTYIIEAFNAESINPGDSITFRGLNVGQVGKVALSKDSRTIEVQIGIQNRYVKLIRTNTVFWRKIGIQANLGLFGSSVKVNSLDSIMHGGLELAVPDNPTEQAKARAKFNLAAEPPKNYTKWNPALE